LMQDDTLYYKWSQLFIKHMALHRDAVKEGKEKAFDPGYINSFKVWNDVYYNYIVNQGKNNVEFFNAIKLMIPIIVISPDNVVDYKLLEQFKKEFPNYAYITSEIENRNNLVKENER
jgi:hypothetical protein